jgi:hypothetical protein
VLCLTGKWKLRQPGAPPGTGPGEPPGTGPGEAQPARAATS